jgi:hypothetical protein
MFPINSSLFPMTSDVRYEIKTPLPDVRLEILIEKIRVGSVRNEHETTKLILVDPVEVDKVRVHRSGFLQLTMRDLKKRKIITHPIDRSSLYLTLLYWLGNILNVITDYLPFVN